MLRYGIPVLLAFMSAQALGDDSERRYYGEKQFLCTWAPKHAPAGNPVEMRFCTLGKAVPVPEIDNDFNAWWRHWYETDLKVAQSLSDQWEIARKQWWRAEEAKLRSARQAAAKKRQAEQVAAMPKMTVPQLCKLLPGPVGIDAHVELVRRQAFSTADLAIIPGGRIELGMSEGAMFCALGAPERSNRSVGSWGVHIQHVYPGVIVYTENGKVTAFQD